MAKSQLTIAITNSNLDTICTPIKVIFRDRPCYTFIGDAKGIVNYFHPWNFWFCDWDANARSWLQKYITTEKPLHLTLARTVDSEPPVETWVFNNVLLRTLQEFECDGPEIVVNFDHAVYSGDLLTPDKKTLRTRISGDEFPC